MTRTWTLWRVLRPKTRGPGASQQPARINDPLITDLLTDVFGNLPAEQPLWPLFPSAFRSRFRAIGKGLGMPETFTPAAAPLTDFVKQRKTPTLLLGVAAG